MEKEALLYETIAGNVCLCRLCAHGCRIEDGCSGVCRVRGNRDGTLYSQVYGELIATHVDPIEKKPLFHFYPGSLSLSIASAGCNFRCSFCQNWQISQAPREGGTHTGPDTSPGEVVENAVRRRCRSISYTYTEPTIFFEFALDTARQAQTAGLENVFVTNGYMTKEALETIHPALHACNVDLKSFRDSFYRTMCGARLQPVLDSIRTMKALGIWLEITTLVIPGQNDSEAEWADIAGFIHDLDPDIPWHLSRFHPDYEYDAAPATPLETLQRAHAVGRGAGLRYVYIGNAPGLAEDTVCPTCGKVLVRRSGYSVALEHLKGGSCGGCGSVIAGRF
ncbi:MAG: AmmeMemoRadiSam system radical SAM enzyme [Acidobacteria bacterium]|nr:AmmeMemoRadiSam system radical SAM enzyme [Acidobacteriota bacterium]